MDRFVRQKPFLPLVFLLLVILPGCAKKAPPLQLPKPQEIESIQIIRVAAVYHYSEREQIKELILKLSAAKPTAKPSIQDAPTIDSFIQIDLQLQKGSNTYFLYKEKGKWYLEFPYQGIYQIDSSFVDLLPAS